MADEHVVPNGDAPLILKAAAGVDKNALAQGDVLPAVAAEGREKGKSLIHGLANELGEEVPNFLRGDSRCSAGR